ncbi:hypothetical protein V8G54_025096, partial [Vigna mungo]
TVCKDKYYGLDVSILTFDSNNMTRKKIRQRVYDALNVLMAMDIISKDNKEIQQKGLPRASLSDIEDIKTERLGLRNIIENKASYFQELEDQVRTPINRGFSLGLNSCA